MHRFRLRLLALAAALSIASIGAAPTVGVGNTSTFSALADDAVATLTTRFYRTGGHWRMCPDVRCYATNSDWGADSLTYVLFERWQLTHDIALVPLFKALQAAEPHYGPCRGTACREWSDQPMWDSVAALRTFDVTHDPVALRNAENAYLSMTKSDAYARGACPDIDYQLPFGGDGGLKTLESDANAVLAAVLLAQRTSRRAYLDQAIRRYAAIRRVFLDVPHQLYTVYVFDNGRRCSQVPRRFFASVNGVMIEAGIELSRITHDTAYEQDARLTAHAAAALDNARGIFTDLQAENDIEAPMVLAMLALSASDAFARDWILRNAAAAAHARTANGFYGRFFDGPPPAGIVTAWQTNGGFALEIAAAALSPDSRAEAGDPWAASSPIATRIATLPSSFSFQGSGIALLGTIGERCCQPGRARVLIDGREMVDLTGIWQNKSSLGRPLPGSVLFAWRWPASGSHVLQFQPDTYNSKEGGPFLSVRESITLP
ncbi:MAG: hypothetical protein NVSMB64_19070 [Candidatus Velthaea sp.]